MLRSDAVTEGPMSLPPVADLPDRPLLVLTQGSFPATVHRAVYPYFVGVSILDDEGNIVGSTGSWVCSPWSLSTRTSSRFL
ncbi:hypothetical protein GCM10020255_091940 [Rhodococcus baikonurensis]